ncbi:polymorphic toxin-type HINT domain-containing protein [Actinoplanes sp. NPDC048988]|uniref:polymorphic toxin-type HINT domain-containing protein n=1 Tax=Actinoplanes sp. NPDC048988 TaxID=3363901 RepID=UPI0037128BD7
MQSVTDTAGSVSYLYDADGNRLISQDTTGKTLYLPNQEIRYTNSTAASSCTRYFGFGGGTLAQRTSKGITWLASDHQGTQNVSVDEDTLTDTIRRQTPFGTARGPAVTWQNTKGFVGGTNDPTGLVHLGAREYDAALGRFISVDPVFNSSDPQSLEGYAYADNSPVVRSDPSGLIAMDEEFGGNSGGADVDAINKQYQEEHRGSEKDEHKSGKKSKKCGWKCKAGKAWNKGSNWVDDHKGVVAGAVVGLAVGIGCDALTLGAGAVACGALAGGIASAVEYSVDTLIDHKGNFSWGGLATNVAIGAIVGGLTGGLSVIAGQGIKAGARALISGAGAKAAASAATAGAKKEASNVVSGLTKNGFGKSAPKASKGAADEAPSGGGCPTHSFAATTLVLMANGKTKAISQIKVGDKVIATDPITGKRREQSVKKIHVNHDIALTDLTVRVNGTTKVLRTTQHHPFWSDTKHRWVNAGDLNSSDALRTYQFGFPEISRVENFTDLRTMYDLTVDVIHTYYVLAGNTPVLVHNWGL